MRITVLYGGKSGEHEISLVSAAAVVRNISPRHDVTLVGISKAGRWFVQPGSELSRVRGDQSARLEVREESGREVWAVPGGGSERAFRMESAFIGADVVFPVLHGTFGEDGTVQGLLEVVDVPYVGCGTGASAWTMDKEKTKVLLKAAGIPVVPWVCVRRSDFSDAARLGSLVRSAEESFGYPMFVKPCSAGSSNGAERARNRAELDSAIRGAFDWDDKILVEKAVDAREIECSVTGNPTTADGSAAEERLCAYGPGEIAPTHGFYDYDAKYNDPDGASLLIPADLPEERLAEVRRAAKRAFAALDLSGLSRVDFFIDRADGSLYLNEINTLPGFTQISMFPKMCAAFGTDFPALTELLLCEAVARFRTTRRLRTSR